MILSKGLALLGCYLFVFFLCVFFVVTVASSFQPVAACAPLGATPSAQIIPHNIKLQHLPAYKGEVDYRVIEAWIYSVDNYFALTCLLDPT